MRKRKVYRLNAGDISRLKVSTESIEPPQKGDMQIEVKAIGLNFADVFAILGLYSATPKGSFIPGLEFSGTVIDVGEGVSKYVIGDKIMGVTRFGAYTTHVNIGQEYISPLPEGWSFDDGASYLVQVLTAFYGLKNLGDIQEGSTVLIHSAAGGVGIWANRIAKRYDAFTIGTVGHEKKQEVLKKEGYDAGIVRNTKTFKAELQQALSGRNLDLIMECIGGKIMKIGFEALGQMGRHIVYGSAQYGDRTDRPNYFKLIPKYLMRPRLDPQNMIAVNKSVMAFNLIYLFEHSQLMHTLLQELSGMTLGKPIIGHRYSFEELPEAIRFFQSGKTIGKVVVNVATNSE